jgi:hypothetical protein
MARENCELERYLEVVAQTNFCPALQAYLGHKNIQHTVCYTELSPKRSRIFDAYDLNNVVTRTMACATNRKKKRRFAEQTVASLSNSKL